MCKMCMAIVVVPISPIVRKYLRLTLSPIIPLSKEKGCTYKTNNICHINNYAIITNDDDDCIRPTVFPLNGTLQSNVNHESIKHFQCTLVIP